MCKKNLLNHIKYFSCNFYTTSWPRQLRLLSANLHSFIVPRVRIQEADQKMHLIFFSSDFYIFFLCICVCNTKGDAHKPCGPPKREGKPILPRVWKDLAHCALYSTQVAQTINLNLPKKSQIPFRMCVFTESMVLFSCGIGQFHYSNFVSDLTANSHN